MTPAIANVLIVSSALAQAISAFIVLFFMQSVTKGAGLHCKLALIQLAQRICYCALSFYLMNNAISIYTDWRCPPFDDMAVFISLMACCMASYVRHRMAPPIPDGASWRNPAHTVAVLKR